MTDAQLSALIEPDHRTTARATIEASRQYARDASAARHDRDQARAEILDRARYMELTDPDVMPWSSAGPQI